jgi:hypothetical protein
LSVARHRIVSQDEAWNLASSALFQMEGSSGPVGAGAIIDSSGLAVTCLSNMQQEGLSRIQLGSQVLSASILARDPEHDIALLQISGGSYASVMLSPESPHAGEILSIPAGTDPAHFQDAEVATVSTGDYFRFRGIQPESANGVAMINRRGELVGISLGRPPGFPGHSHGLGIDASTIRALLNARHDLDGPAKPAATRVAEMLFGSVPQISQRTAPSASNGKLSAGEAMGNYPLGMTMELLTRELGHGEVVYGRDGFQTVDFATPRLRFTVVKDRVVAIESDFGFYSTQGGMSPGAPADTRRLNTEVPGAVLGDSKPGVGVASGVGIEAEAYQGKVARLRVVPR